MGSADAPLSPKVPLGALAGVFLRIGNLTFGGGNPTVAALQRELVDNRKWLERTQFALCYALARMTPGTNLFAFDTAAGWLMGGWRGALLCVLVASIPCCLIVAILTAFFDLWSGQRLVAAAIDGALAASVGILLASFWFLVSPYIAKTTWVRSCVIVLLSIGLSFGAGLTPIAVLAVSALVGFFWKEPARE